jgi:uncharacterized protein
LKYDLRDIGEAGLAVQHHLDSSQVRRLLVPVGVELTDGEEYEEYVEVAVRLTPASTSAGATAIHVRGSIRGQFNVVCARCLGTAPVVVDEAELSLTFMPPSDKSPAEREELNEDDLDTFVHDGVQVDLEPVIREQLVLAIPITPLCSEDCKGICGGCGVDLNRASCECKEASSSATPWAAALSRLKANNN